MAEKTFAQALNDHVPNEFAASQAYLAAAIYYDDLTMPRMAAFFFRQAIEERNHAMMIIQYLLDIEEEATIPGVAAPKTDFADLVEPVKLALDQERKVTQQFNVLTSSARAANDFQGEQFLQWFLKEQVEEVALMSDLLTVVERAKDRPLDIEEYLAREGLGDGEADDPSAPPAAGGAI
ncbi:MAG: bacterioferritin [Solirubrobacterales bacterium]|jgi:ferritin|nr:bacterioferritin [Solirubrobacterales bacterium]